MKPYGKELILDLHECDVKLFTKEFIGKYFKEVCSLIDMERCELVWWEDKEATEPHLRGTSAVQFIKTSNITIHALDLMGNIYINIFSCKDFDDEVAKTFSKNWFEGRVANCQVIERV